MSHDTVSKGDLFKPDLEVDRDLATVYFFQPDQELVNSCLLLGVNGEYKGCIGYPCFIKTYIKPGKHRISFTPNAPVKIANLSFYYSFKAGKDYYFEYQELSKSQTVKAAGSTYNALLGTHIGWVPLTKTEALAKLNELRSWQ